MTTDVHFTQHAEERISKRLAGIVTREEVEAKIREQEYEDGKQTWVLIKRLRRKLHFNDGVQDLVGDSVIAAVIVNDGQPNLTTVLLRNSSKPIKADRFIP